MHGAALIGYGIQGRRMAATLRQHRAFAIRAVWDPDPGARAAAAAELPGIATPGDPAAIFADPSIAVIYVASPPASHLRHVGRALDAGKAVFCEKPLSTDREAAAAMVARIEREGARAAVNFSLAHAPAFLSAAEALAAGAIGTPRAVAIDVAFRQWPRPWQADAARWLAGAAEGGFTREVVSHFIWVTRRLFGPLAVRSSSVRRPAPGAAEVALEAAFAAGAVTGSVSGTVGGSVAEDDRNAWTLEGTAGALRIFDWYRFARRGAAGWDEVDLGPADDRRERSRLAQLDALAAMVEGRPHGLPSFREALDVQSAVEAMLAGA